MHEYEANGAGGSPANRRATPPLPQPDGAVARTTGSTYEVDLVERVLKALDMSNAVEQKKVLDELARYIEPAVLRGANRVLIHSASRGQLKTASREVFSITFLRLIREKGRGLRTWDPNKGTLPVWVWKIAYRRALDWVGRRPRDIPSQETEDTSDEGAWAELLEREDFLDRLFQRIAEELSPADVHLSRMLLELRWEAAQIAEQLGISTNSVYQRVFRLKPKLLEIARRLREEP